LLFTTCFHLFYIYELLLLAVVWFVTHTPAATLSARDAAFAAIYACSLVCVHCFIVLLTQNVWHLKCSTCL